MDVAESGDIMYQECALRFEASAVPVGTGSGLARSSIASRARIFITGFAALGAMMGPCASGSSSGDSGMRYHYER